MTLNDTIRVAKKEFLGYLKTVPYNRELFLHCENILAVYDQMQRRIPKKAIPLDNATLMLKNIPPDQAIQKIKSSLSGKPETVTIPGKLKIILE